MQTFLPYPDYEKSAACLDASRLGNQFYREGMTLIRGNWRHHPASKMWQPYIYHLGLYLLACYEELINRGLHYPKHEIEIRNIMKNHENVVPIWLGRQDFHASHRSNLLRKDPLWYGQFGWTEPNNLPYVWPV